MWILGILMPLFYIYIYGSNGLFANAGINIYYVGASIYGFCLWKSGRQKNNSAIQNFPKRRLLPLLIILALLTIAAYFLLHLFNESQQPLLDGFTAALNIIGMWMLAKKYYQEWIVWIISDPFVIVMCILSNLWPTAIMYTIYLIVSIYGYLHWKKEYESNRSSRQR